MYILILIVFTSGSFLSLNNKSQTTIVEFTSKNTCEKAAAEYKNSYNISARCVKK